MTFTLCTIIKCIVWTLKRAFIVFICEFRTWTVDIGKITFKLFPLYGIVYFSTNIFPLRAKSHFGFFFPLSSLVRRLCCCCDFFFCAVDLFFSITSYCLVHFFSVWCVLFLHNIANCCCVFTWIEIFRNCSFSQQVIVVHLHEPVLLLLRDFCFVTSKDSICWSCCKRQLLDYAVCQIQSLHHLRYRFAIMMLNA